MAILAFYHVWVLVTVNDGVRMAVIGFFISVNRHSLNKNMQNSPKVNN